MPRPALDLRHLEMLLALADTGSLTRSAGQLAITQSAVTHRLGEAERRLGVKLAKKVGRRVLLTDAGERLRSVAIRCLEEISRTERGVVAQFGRSMEIVRFGQAVYSRFRWLPGFFASSQEALRGVELELVARATWQPFQTLQDGNVDIVSISGPRPPRSVFEWIHLMRDPLVAVLPPGHRLARLKHVDPARLAGERFIAHAHSPEPGFEAPRDPLRPPANSAKDVQLPEAIIDLVGAGLGVSILPFWAVEPEVASGNLVARPLSPEGRWIDWWAVIRPNEPPGSATRRVVEALVRWCDRPETDTIERLSRTTKTRRRAG